MKMSKPSRFKVCFLVLATTSVLLEVIGVFSPGWFVLKGSPAEVSSFLKLKRNSKSNYIGAGSANTDKTEPVNKAPYSQKSVGSSVSHEEPGSSNLSRTDTKDSENGPLLDAKLAPPLRRDDLEESTTWTPTETTDPMKTRRPVWTVAPPSTVIMSKRTPLPKQSSTRRSLSGRTPRVPITPSPRSKPLSPKLPSIPSSAQITMKPLPTRPYTKRPPRRKPIDLTTSTRNQDGKPQSTKPTIHSSLSTWRRLVKSSARPSFRPRTQPPSYPDRPLPPGTAMQPSQGPITQIKPAQSWPISGNAKSPAPDERAAAHAIKSIPSAEPRVTGSGRMGQAKRLKQKGSLSLGLWYGQLCISKCQTMSLSSVHVDATSVKQINVVKAPNMATWIDIRVETTCSIAFAIVGYIATMLVVKPLCHTTSKVPGIISILGTSISGILSIVALIRILGVHSNFRNELQLTSSDVQLGLPWSAILYVVGGALGVVLSSWVAMTTWTNKGTTWMNFSGDKEGKNADRNDYKTYEEKFNYVFDSSMAESAEISL